MDEKYSSINRVVGSVDKQTMVLADAMAEHYFRSAQLPENLRGAEREKTPVQRRLVSLADRLTNVFLQTYGYDTIEIPEKNIHILDNSVWRPNVVGQFSTRDQNVYLKDRGASSLFFEDTTHEMFHLKSYGAVQMDPGFAKEYRLGLAAYSRDGQSLYFNNLSEALTEKLTMSVYRATDDPAIEGDRQRVRYLKSKYGDLRGTSGDPIFSSETTVATEKEYADGRVYVSAEKFTYQEQRKVFDLLLNKIFQANRGNVSKKAIMGMFMDGMFDGNLLGLGKLIDRSFGRGTFRRIGETDRDLGQLRSLVENL